MPHLAIDNLSADYGSAQVLKDVSLGVERGEILSIIGPSGSGKSTLLRVLIGLLRPKAGQVAVAGQRVDYGSSAALRRLRERFAIVFQQYNLFQNMTVLKNVTIAPVIVKKQDPRVAEDEARLLLDRIGLSHRMDAYPDQLSGGQQQRVAIARALALRPEVLLLDEITSALDPERVAEVLDTIRLLAADGVTMLLVSHEMSFVREVSSKVAFMADGHVVEVGPPSQIFDAPLTERCAEFTSRILRH